MKDKAKKLMVFPLLSFHLYYDYNFLFKIVASAVIVASVAS